MKEKVRGRPSKELLAEHQEHLLDIATEEFLEHGFKAASIDGIARKAGVGKLTIYRRFDGKKGLFLAVAEWVLQHGHPLATVSTEGGSPEQVLLDFSLAIYQGITIVRTREITRMAVAEAREFPEVARRYYESAMVSLEPLVRFLELLDREGILSVPDPLRAAIDFTNLTVDGLRFLVMEPLPEEERMGWCTAVIRVFMDGYRRRSI
ncbi:TetR/AcrR family transcriptional regulator [Pseudomonas sp. BF-R-19]|uniref:TetR/AcrR family transcriptional regulator n=1 Tax=Pseudomonas sp. BF-R-19 TaxID=2832397 RepID=UPI001CBE9973|nr:TetR/AcrR family transcriptional regulator [Pseudomonas sp. BF-R-19]